MITIVGGLLMLLTSLWATLGMFVGTCTQGSADEIVAGAFYGVIGYSIGIGLLVARPPTGRGWLWLMPVVVVVAYQAYLAGSFFVAYQVHGLPACAWKLGDPDFGMADGGEPWLTWLWIGVPAFAFAGLAMAWFRSERLR
jgi:hypothetical protein